MSADPPKARGCLAGHCDIAGKTEGQHHNGGCHCLNGMDPPKRRELRGEMARLRAEAERLTVENAALYGEQDAATKAIVDRHGVRLDELRAEAERLKADLGASDKLATIVDEAARGMEAHIEQLTQDTASARASRDASKTRSRMLLERAETAERLLRELASILGCSVDGPGMAQRIVDLRERAARVDQAERERDDTVEALGFGPAVVGPAKGVAAFFGTLHTEFLAKLADEDSTAVVEPAEMTVLREWAKTSMITVDEHEENRRVEALDDAKAAALLAGPTGGDQ